MGGAKLKKTIPGKCFLLGEYLALSGGPSLVFTIKNLFEYEIIKDETGQSQNPFPQGSPAFKFFHEKTNLFKSKNIRFYDYSGVGGFGASTAQFIAAYEALTHKDPLQNYFETPFNKTNQQDQIIGLDLATDCWQEYRKLSWEGQGTQPSGNDLLAQFFGALALVDTRNNTAVNVKSISEWPYHKLELLIVATGKKQATHEHLKALGSFDSQDLSKAMAVAVEAMAQSNSDKFIQSVNQYHQALLSLGFMDSNSRALIEEFKIRYPVLAAKACGAMGTDAVLLLVESIHGKSLKRELQERFPAVYTTCDLAEVRCEIQSIDMDLNQNIKEHSLFELQKSEKPLDSSVRI